MTETTIDQQDVIETPAPAEETVETPPTETSEQSVEEDELTRVKKEKEDLEQKNKKLYARLKETEKKTEVKQGNTNLPQNLTNEDLLSLVDIPKEDRKDVVEWAHFKKISIEEAKKDKILQVSLREKAEERQTANVTSVKGGRGFIKETPEDIIARASKGDLPEDDEGITKLAEAHQAIKMRRIQK